MQIQNLQYSNALFRFWQHENVSFQSEARCFFGNSSKVNWKFLFILLPPPLFSIVVLIIVWYSVRFCFWQLAQRSPKWIQSSLRQNKAQWVKFCIHLSYRFARVILSQRTCFFSGQYIRLEFDKIISVLSF